MEKCRIKEKKLGSCGKNNGEIVVVWERRCGEEIKMEEKDVWGR